jgi:hypothetical protein
MPVLTMVEKIQFIMLGIVILLSLAVVRSQPDETSGLVLLIQKFAARQGLVVSVIGSATLLGCLAVASCLHEPIPRIHDEFSYLLMSDTFASGRVSNPAPVLPEFFETFHVLVRPVYVSKYFPAQGLFLALGEKLTGHPAVGVWLSSVLACAATCWMLQAWTGPVWALLGGILMAVQLGIYSYWSQTYWGGMVAALGGALVFGAYRRLWPRLSWQNSVWLAVGLVILANSRPLEGVLAALPLSALFLVRTAREQWWRTASFWIRLILPAGLVLLFGAAATLTYNRAITGSPLMAPYSLHEKQYQESPPFIFMPMRAPITYSSPWLEYYYHYQEMRLYALQRTPAQFIRLAARKLASWWAFYCGVLLTAPLVLPGLQRPGWLRVLQLLTLIGLLALGAAYNPVSTAICSLIDILVLVQIALLWLTFEDYWERIALVTIGLVLLETLFVKVAFPHYSAPTACLILFLQVQGLRRLWSWNSQSNRSPQGRNRAERRRSARSQAKGQPKGLLIYPWRGLVFALPLVCLISLGVRVEARVKGWSEDPHGPDRDSLPMHDWSLRRAELEQWLEQQPQPQLVFVTYSARHRVAYEWVFNHADLRNSHVIWARDLGAYENGKLIEQLQGRQVWSLKADVRVPQLAPYSQSKATEPVVPETPVKSSADDALNW